MNSKGKGKPYTPYVYGGSRGIAMFILNLDTGYMWWVNLKHEASLPWGRSPGIHWIGRWVGPRRDMDAFEEQYVEFMCTTTHSSVYELAECKTGFIRVRPKSRVKKSNRFLKPHAVLNSCCSLQGEDWFAAVVFMVVTFTFFLQPTVLPDLFWRNKRRNYFFGLLHEHQYQVSSC